MRFHLIDRVDACEPMRSVRARKLTSLAEEYWEVTEDGPAMPPPLVLESLCQAGAWLLLISTRRARRGALVSIGSVKFHAAVRPGDVLILEGTVTAMNEERAVFSGTATVNGQVVLEAKDILCTLMDADALEAPDATRRLEAQLTRPPQPGPA